jgi:hypothetical protein
VDRHRFDADPDPTFHFEPNQIRIRIRIDIKTIPIHEADPAPSCKHVGKQGNFILFLFAAMPVYNGFFLISGKCVKIISILGSTVYWNFHEKSQTYLF